LPELKEMVNEIPTEKSIVAHYKDGYCNAAGSSILANRLSGSIPIFDLGQAVSKFL